MMRGKTRTGLALITLSSAFLVVTVIMMLSGLLHSQQVAYTEKDLDPGSSPSRYEKSFEVALFSTLNYRISGKEDRIRYMITVEGPDGDEIYKDNGVGDGTDMVELRGSGKYTFILELRDRDASVDDLDLELRISGPILLATCCISGLTGVIFITILLTGSIYMLLGYIEEKRRWR